MKGAPLPDFDAVEASFQESFATGDTSSLDVIGYGEITSVVAWPTESGIIACRRLPEFGSTEARDAYRDAFLDYTAALEKRSVPLLPMTFHEYEGENGKPIGYLLQEVVSADRIASAAIRDMDDAEGRALVEEICRHTAAVVSDPLLGFDAQLANWVVGDGGLLYLDVTPPFVRDSATGAVRLDTRIFVASLPWFLRSPVQRWLAPSIVAEYFDLRTLLLNLVANLIKEGADRWIPIAVEVSREFVPDIEYDDVTAYYRRDALMWELLQRLRRVDRWWQLRVRRRPYPVILPGKVSRFG